MSFTTCSKYELLYSSFFITSSHLYQVCDRLLSALGQDVLECLFSKETLERKPDGRSKILRPFWLFLLALIYNLVHATALFYQVITLNVAVNSYSNALLTLLMSNQFVEIKSTVFKKIEKDNLFQLTCADVVERFQLWLMLIIIASRNIIETNSLGGSSSAGSATSSPVRSSSILPKSFTIFPDWTGQVMGPFLLVLGTEMLVDWLKHAYITKFNNTKPNIYGRFLDVLAKDYYSNVRFLSFFASAPFASAPFAFFLIPFLRFQASQTNSRPPLQNRPSWTKTSPVASASPPSPSPASSSAPPSKPTTCSSLLIFPCRSHLPLPASPSNPPRRSLLLPPPPLSHISITSSAARSAALPLAPKTHTLSPHLEMQPTMQRHGAPGSTLSARMISSPDSPSSCFSSCCISFSSRRNWFWACACFRLRAIDIGV